jgi:hypothetical protein
MPFQPPAASARQVAGVPFDRAVDFAPAVKQKIDAFDRRPSNRDPSKCKALLKFPDTAAGRGAVFWSSKMGIDTDGPAAGPGHRTGSQLDPNPGVGQNTTSLTISDSPKGIPSEAVPYIVLPGRGGSNDTFDPAVAIGDMAIVIFKDKITAAVCGDLGPSTKIGEASIHVHEALQPACPDPCPRRDSNGFCVKARNSSVEQDVLYFVFPGSAFDKSELTLANINTKVNERAFGLYNKLRGAS